MITAPMQVSKAWQPKKRPTSIRGPKDHTNIRILEAMISGIPLMLGLRTRMPDPSVDVGFWALSMEEKLQTKRQSSGVQGVPYRPGY